VLAVPPLAAVSSIAHVKQPIRVLELLVTTSPGGGPKHIWDLVQHLPRSEFELVIGAPCDGIFFDRFRDRGLEVVEFPLSHLGARHFHLTRGVPAESRYLRRANNCGSTRTYSLQSSPTHSKARGRAPERRRCGPTRRRIPWLSAWSISHIPLT